VVRGLLGEGEPKARSPARSAMARIVEMCNRAFGPPENLPGEADVKGTLDPTEYTKKPSRPRVGVTHDNPTRGTGGGTSGTRTTTKKEKKERPLVCIKIGDRTYRVLSGRVDERTVAEISCGSIIVNDAYGGFPSRREARDEHLLNAVLLAVAHNLKDDQPLEFLQEMVYDWRKVLIPKE